MLSLLLAALTRTILLLFINSWNIISILGNTQQFSIITTFQTTSTTCNILSNNYQIGLWTKAHGGCIKLLMYMYFLFSHTQNGMIVNVTEENQQKNNPISSDLIFFYFNNRACLLASRGPHPFYCENTRHIVL
jgi:hypothetical protein